MKGELGIERGTAASGAPDWMVSCDRGRWNIRVTAETHLYLRIPPEATAEPPVLSVLFGVAHLSLPGRQGEVQLAAGQTAQLDGDTPDIGKKAALPDWRADLCSEKELGEMLNGISQVIDRTPEGPRVELTYGFGRTSLGNDWRSKKDGPPLTVQGGVLRIPNGSRCVLNARLAAPLQIEATVSADVPADCPWGLAFQCGEKQCLSLDLGKEAVLNVNAKPVPRVARMAYRTVAQTAERIRLDISADKEGEAILSTAAGKTQALPVPKKLLTPGTLQIQALGEGLTLDGLRIQGVLPRAWVLKHMTLKTPSAIEKPVD